MTIKVQTNVQGKVYYTNSGKVLLSNQNEPVINSLSVTPTTSSQTITAPSGVDGYSPINVAAVTSSIDANIVAGNIKDGVTILGVTGSYQGSGGGSSRFGLSLDNFIGNVTNGVLGAPNTINGITFTGVTEIAQSALFHFFYYTQLLSGAISAPSLTIIRSLGLAGAFSGNQITSVDLSALTTVGANAMYDAFSYNQIEHIYFRALTSNSFEDESCFDNMLEGNDGATVHFPSNLQAVIGNWASVLNGFGGTNTTVLFDLPATS